MKKHILCSVTFFF